MRVSNTEFPQFGSVLADDVATGAMAARYLLEKGFRRFLLVANGPQPNQATRERLDSFAATVGGDGDCRWVWDAASIRHQFRDMAKPVAAFAWNDARARWLIELACMEGWQVPRDLAVLGVDSDPTQSLVSPISISSVALPLAAIGQVACEAVLASQDAAGGADLRVRLPPLQVTEGLSTAMEVHADERVNFVRRFIQDRAAGPLTVNEIAMAAACSRRALERRFRETVGTSIRQEIVAARVALARQSLAGSREPMEQIAEACGFPDYRAFLRDFQAVQGCSPRAYRRMVGNVAHRPVSSPSTASNRDRDDGRAGS